MKISRNQLRRVIREQLLNEAATKSKMSRHKATLKQILGDNPSANEDDAREKVSGWGGLSVGQRDDLNKFIDRKVAAMPKAFAAETPEEEEDALSDLPEEGEDTDDEEEVEFSWNKKTWTVDDDKWPLTQGEHGDAVKKLQVAVGVEPDGYYGDVTATAVDKYVEGNGETVTAEEHAKLLETQPGKGGSGGAPAEAEAEAEEAEEEAGDLLDQAADLAISAAGGGERSEAMWDAGRENMDSATDLGGFLRGVADKGVEFLGDEASKKMSALADQAEDVAQDAIDDAEDFISDKIDGGLSEARHRRQRTLRNRHSGGTVSRAQIRSMILREMLKRQ